MKNNIALVVSIIALAMASLGFYFQYDHKIKAQEVSESQASALDKYSFATPLQAYKSEIKMNATADEKAIDEYWVARNGDRLSEKIATLEVIESSDYEGSVIIFVEYKEDGLPKREAVQMEKDAKTGYWFNDGYISTYDIKDKNPALAKKIEEWNK